MSREGGGGGMEWNGVSGVRGGAHHSVRLRRSAILQLVQYSSQQKRYKMDNYAIDPPFLCFLRIYGLEFTINFTLFL